MALLNLPNEIIFEIVEYFDKEQDIYSLVRVNKRFHHLLDDYLYCYVLMHVMLRPILIGLVRSIGSRS